MGQVLPWVNLRFRLKEFVGLTHGSNCFTRDIWVGIRRRRTRTVKVRTALSRPCPAGQTDNGQLFFYNPDRIERGKIWTDRHRTENPDRIRIADRHRTRFSGKSGQKRDKDRTRTVLSADDWLGLDYAKRIFNIEG